MNPNRHRLPFVQACRISDEVQGDPDRWPEIARLNNISKDNPYRMGDCLKVFDVEW